jgi:hypothetical protein
MFDRSDTCPHLPDLLSDRQERDFDSSVRSGLLVDNVIFIGMPERLGAGST